MKQLIRYVKDHNYVSAAVAAVLVLVVTGGLIVIFAVSDSPEKTDQAQRTKKKSTQETSTSETTTPAPLTESTGAPSVTKSGPVAPKVTTTTGPKYRVVSATGTSETKTFFGEPGTLEGSLSLVTDPTSTSFPIKASITISIIQQPGGPTTTINRVVTQSSTDNGGKIPINFDVSTHCGHASYWANIEWAGGNLLSRIGRITWSSQNYFCTDP